MRNVIRRETRLCGGCGQTKRLTASHWHRRGDGFATRCKLCMNRAVRGNHGKHREKFRALKEANPCMDCGVSYPWYVMQYDHRPGTDKKGEVGKMVVGSYKWETILAEIAKCDLVCGNCHLARTYLRSIGEL